MLVGCKARRYVLGKKRAELGYLYWWKCRQEVGFGKALLYMHNNISSMLGIQNSLQYFQGQSYHIKSYKIMSLRGDKKK